MGVLKESNTRVRLQQQNWFDAHRLDVLDVGRVGVGPICNVDRFKAGCTARALQIGIAHPDDDWPATHVQAKAFLQDLLCYHLALFQ